MGVGLGVAEAFAAEPRVQVVCNDGNPGFSAANNQGAAVGLSTGIGLPTVNAPRATWEALPPPRLVDPSAADAGTDTRKAAP